MNLWSFLVWVQFCEDSKLPPGLRLYQNTHTIVYFLRETNSLVAPWYVLFRHRKCMSPIYYLQKICLKNWIDFFGLLSCQKMCSQIFCSLSIVAARFPHFIILMMLWSFIWHQAPVVSFEIKVTFCESKVPMWAFFLGFFCFDCYSFICAVFIEEFGWRRITLRSEVWE